MGTVIAIVSGKGGTGKTTCTALLGAALSNLGRKTLLLDCDIGLRNLDLALGLSDRTLMDFTDVLSGSATLQEAAVRHPRLPELSLLTAPVNLGENDLAPDTLRPVLDAAREAYDFCLIDAAAGIGGGFRLATACADRVVVVATSDPASLRDAQRTVMELSAFPDGRAHMIVNRFRRDLLRSLRTDLDDAIDAAGLPLLGVIPDEEDVPILLGRGEVDGFGYYSTVKRACRNIARRLCGEHIALMKL